MSREEEFAEEIVRALRDINKTLEKMNANLKSLAASSLQIAYLLRAQIPPQPPPFPVTKGLIVLGTPVPQ